MAEAFLAGLIGFLIGRGIEPKDAQSIVETIRAYIGFEPPLGLTGYALDDLEKGKQAKAAVVVRGKTYDALALEQVRRNDEIAVLGKRDAYLEVAPTVVRGIAGAAFHQRGTGTIPNETAFLLVEYEVPVGKTLLVYEWSALLRANAGVGGQMNEFQGEYLAYGGGFTGFHHTFVTPKRVNGGKKLQVYLYQASGAPQWGETIVDGILT